MKKNLFLFIFFLYCTDLKANDLLNSLSDAFKNNSKLNAQRANLNASMQDINISRGEFLPTVTLSGDKSTVKNTNRTNMSGEKLLDTNSIPETRSVIIKQKIFDGFGNFNNLKKSKLKLEYAKFELNKLEQEVLLNAATAYYSLAYNFESYEFNKSNVELFERQR